MANNLIMQGVEILALVGAANWLFFAFGYNLVTIATTAANQATNTNLVYGVIGFAGVYLLYTKYLDRKKTQ